MTYICCVKYKYKKKAQLGAMVNGDPIKAKKAEKKRRAMESGGRRMQAIFDEVEKRFQEEFPNVRIPEKAMKDYAMVYILSGRSEDAMKDMISKEKQRQIQAKDDKMVDIIENAGRKSNNL